MLKKIIRLLQIILKHFILIVLLEIKKTIQSDFSMLLNFLETTRNAFLWNFRSSSFKISSAAAN